MAAANNRTIHSLTRIFGVCLGLVMVGAIILGTAGSMAATTSGSPPEIRAFTADPMVVKDGGSVLYSFEVWNATSVQINEAGDIIKQVTSPPSTTLKGTAKGRTTFQIRTGNSNSFDAVLLAGNAAGKRDKKLTIKFAAALQVKSTTTATSQAGGATDNRTRTPQWLAQVTPATTAASSGTAETGVEPKFYKCPESCNYCLRPDDAAGRGFTQRCSENPCYYSPDGDQKWYCYSKPVTVWCCADGRVKETTKDVCAQAGGTYYATEAEANKACQQVTGWVCSNGNVYPGTQAQAAQAGLTWYATQAEAARYCNPTGWCCRDGKIGATTQSQCIQLGGYWSATQGEAIRACQQQVTGWFCMNGNVYQGTQSQAAQVGATWYATQSEAARYCQQPASCWCCAGGKVFQTTQAACSRSGGSCYPDQKSATAACYRTTPQTPIIPNRTLK
jgi:hypothetical protein